MYRGNAWYTEPIIHVDAKIPCWEEDILPPGTKLNHTNVEKTEIQGIRSTNVILIEEQTQ